MKNYLLFALIGFSMTVFGQHPTYRNNGFHYKASASLGAGAETVMAFPPKLSFHVYLPRSTKVYAGIDAGLCTFGFSKMAGVTAGLKLNVFLIENTFAWTSVYQSRAPNKMWLSNNPKIGIEIGKFMLKAGPSFVLRQYNGHHELLDWFKLGSQHFNIEIGYIFDSN